MDAAITPIAAVSQQTVHAIESAYQRASDIIARVGHVALQALRLLFWLPIIALDWMSGCAMTVRWRDPIVGGLHAPLPSTLLAPNRLLLTESSHDSQAWKVELIRHADDSIVFSSAYMAGAACRDILNAMEERLIARPRLHVWGLVNFDLLQYEDRQAIEGLRARFPDRFHFRVAHVRWQLAPDLRKFENHTKYLVVDGTYFVTGGTNSADGMCAEYAVDHPQRGLLARLRNAGVHLRQFICGYGTRDADLVGAGPLARDLLADGQRLWTKWGGEGRIDASTRINLAVERILARHRPSIAMAQLHPGRPEDGDGNAATQAYVRLLDTAKKTAVVANMEFNERQLVDAAKRAVARGVEVTVVSNGSHLFRPLSNFLYGLVNRASFQQLFDAAQQHTLRVFQSNRPGLLYHKKMLVVDGSTLLIGSYNGSFKSAISDDEHVVEVRSIPLAQQALRGVFADIELSTPFHRKDIPTPSHRLHQALGTVVEALTRGVMG